MSIRKASIKETGEEVSQEEWARFDAAVAMVRSERPRLDRPGGQRPRSERQEGVLTDVPDETHPDAGPRR